MAHHLTYSVRPSGVVASCGTDGVNLALLRPGHHERAHRVAAHHVQDRAHGAVRDARGDHDRHAPPREVARGAHLREENLRTI